jgi:serine/threonine-protein kinase RsbW
MKPVKSPWLAKTTYLLTSRPAGVRLARAVARRALAGWPQDLIDTAELLVSELVTNAIAHAGSEPVMTLELSASTLRVSVEDDLPSLPSTPPVDLDDESGRGLMLVGALSTSWGWAATPTGKLVWFELTRMLIASEASALAPPVGKRIRKRPPVG